jgi:hypothetical protein
MSSECSRGGTIPYGLRHAFAPGRQQPAAFAGPSPSARRAAERTYISAKAHPGPLRRLKGDGGAPARRGMAVSRASPLEGIGFQPGHISSGVRSAEKVSLEPPGEMAAITGQ